MLRLASGIDIQPVGPLEEVADAVGVADQGLPVRVEGFDGEIHPVHGEIAAVAQHDPDPLVIQIQVVGDDGAVEIRDADHRRGGIAPVLGDAGNGRDAGMPAVNGADILPVPDGGDVFVLRGPVDVLVVGVAGLDDRLDVQGAVQLYMVHAVLDGNPLHRLNHGDPGLSPPVGAVGGGGGNGGGSPGNAGHDAVFIDGGDPFVVGREGHFLDVGVLRLHVPGQLRRRPDGQGNVSAREFHLLDPLDDPDGGRGGGGAVALAGGGNGAFAALDRRYMAQGVHRRDGRIGGTPDDAPLVGLQGLNRRVQLGALARHNVQGGFPQGDPRRLLGHGHRIAGRPAGAVQRPGLDDGLALFHAGHHAVQIHRGHPRIPGGPFRPLNAGIRGLPDQIQKQVFPGVDHPGLARDRQLFGRLCHQHVIGLIDFRVLLAGDDQLAFPRLEGPDAGSPDGEHPLVAGGHGDLPVAGVLGRAGNLQLQALPRRNHQHLVGRVLAQQRADRLVLRAVDAELRAVQRHVGDPAKHVDPHRRRPDPLAVSQRRLDGGNAFLSGCNHPVGGDGRGLLIPGGIGQIPALGRIPFPGQRRGRGFALKEADFLFREAEHVRRQGGAHAQRKQQGRQNNHNSFSHMPSSCFRNRNPARPRPSRAGCVPSRHSFPARPRPPPLRGRRSLRGRRPAAAPVDGKKGAAGAPRWSLSAYAYPDTIGPAPR